MKVYGGATVSGNIHHPDGDAGDVGDGSQIHADILCGEGVHIAPNVTIVGKDAIRLGDGVTIAPGAVIYSSRPDMDAASRNGYREGHRPERGPVTLEDDVFVGANAVVGHGVTIAEGVAVGACSFVDSNINEPRTVWAGQPAGKIRDCLPEPKEELVRP